MAERAVRWCLGGVLWLAASCVLGCATTFVGDAQFPGGALGCFKQCQKIGMEMASFVYVGEYSSACACKLKQSSGALSSSNAEDIEGAVMAAGAGVEMQRRRAASAQAGTAGAR